MHLVGERNGGQVYEVYRRYVSCFRLDILCRIIGWEQKMLIV